MTECLHRNIERGEDNLLVCVDCGEYQNFELLGYDE